MTQVKTSKRATNKKPEVIAAPPAEAPVTSAETKAKRKSNTRSTVKQIPCAQIRAGNNDRKHFEQNALNELASSIQQHGLAQPITVRPMEGGQWYEIVAGERRFRAISQVLGWDKAPCLVRDLSDEEASAIMLVENTSRVDLDPIAEANAYNLRVQKFGWTVTKIAEAAGVNVDRVRTRLQLLELAEDIQHYVKIGQFPLGHAQLLHQLDINRQRIALRVFNSARSMPLTRFREVVAELVEQQAAESQMNLFELELRMVEAVSQEEQPSRRGKKARTGAPVKRDLPAVRVGGRDTVGDIMDRYIADLLQKGQGEAAQAIGTIYNALVAVNSVQVPVTSLLAKIAEDDVTAGDIAPVELI